MVDVERISHKLEFIAANLQKLKHLAELSREHFQRDFWFFDSAAHNLQVSIEAMIDIADHIIARKRLRAPQGNADSFRVLYEAGIIQDEQELATFMKMARFRNRVVHMYQEVSQEEVYNILHRNLGDFERFVRIILQKVLREPKKQGPNRDPAEGLS